MSIKPILFSAPMIRALLEGHKTQTRRIAKRQDIFYCYGRPFVRVGVHSQAEFTQPGYAIGDLLWVREPWGHDAPDLDSCRRGVESDGPSYGPYYMADGTWADNHTIKRKPSIHMPRWASRLTLAVTDVRVQRLNEISERDAMAEGVPRHPVNAESWTVPGYHPNSFPMTAPTAFSLLWDSIHGPGSWDLNPWIVAVTFTVHKVNVDQYRAQYETRDAAQ